MTERREQAVADAAARLAASIPDAFPGDAHSLLMAIYKDPSMPIELRVDAAKSAIRYEKPAMQSIQHSGPEGEALKQDNRIEIVFVSPDEIK